MRINSKICHNAATERFVEIMSRVSDKDIEFYNFFNYKGPYDYSICVNHNNDGMRNPVVMIGEAINNAPYIWMNFEDWSRNHKYVINWNRKVTSVNSLYVPFVFWYIEWESDMFDDDLNFRFDFVQKKHLLTFANSNKRPAFNAVRDLYSERIRFINTAISILDRNEFHIYGNGWDGTYHNHTQEFVKLKSDTMKNYRFAIVIENQTHDIYCDGYVTEKIYDALRNYTIPIYWGAPNITDIVPQDCFIDYRHFNCSPVEIINYIRNMPHDEYENYLHNIDKYIRSEKYYEINHPSVFYKKLSDLLNQ